MKTSHIRQCINQLLMIITLILILGLVSCSEEEPQIEPTPSNSRNKIMPLGASRVEGARPAFESFRYELWKLLQVGDWEFDYIGTQTDDASYPAFQQEPFDQDHEGRGGWTSGEILEGISGWLSVTGTPDVVLFSSPGGNDALQGMDYDNVISNINAIIDVIQSANPEVTIIIEQLAPGHSDIMTGELQQFFNRIQTDLPEVALVQSTNTSQVIVVDMFTGFNDDLLADDVHYNEAGAQFIAERYYEVLENVLEQ